MNYPLRTLLISLLGSFALGANFGLEVPSVREIAKQMNYRQGSWIAMQSQVNLLFQNGEAEKTAQCSGNLIYHRLDEKIMLKCYNEKSELLFIFKTDDWFFDLYIADQETVYSGNIFDLEETEALESHIKPLSFYRALKAQRFLIRNAEVETWEKNSVYLKIQSRRNGKTFVSRKLKMTEEGDVTKEIYFLPDEQTDIIIDRSEFRSYQNIFKQNIFFPHMIKVQDLGQKKDEHKTTTTFLFENVSFLSEVKSNEWEMSIPSETKRVNVRGRFFPVLAGA